VELEFTELAKDVVSVQEMPSKIFLILKTKGRTMECIKEGGLWELVDM
jgi:hypothetical protein